MRRQSKNYSEFGTLLFNILAEYQPPTSKKNKNTMSEYLIYQMKRRGEQTGAGYRSNVTAWLNGDIVGSKRLSPNSFYIY
jgi:hypothetical protein